MVIQFLVFFAGSVNTGVQDVIEQNTNTLAIGILGLKVPIIRSNNDEESSRLIYYSG